MAEETKSLPDQTGSDLGLFSALFERSSELRDVLSRLPGQLVLKSGMSAQRSRLIEGWDKLESPGLDGSISSDAIEGIRTWIRKAEVCIAYVIQIGERENKQAFGKAFAGNVYEPEFEVVESISEVDFVSDNWCWPWPEQSLAVKKKSSVDKDKMFKYGAVGFLGLLAVATYMDEDA